METQTEKRKTVKLRVTEPEHAWLLEVAAREERSIASVLRMALREFYDRRAGK